MLLAATFFWIAMFGAVVSLMALVIGSARGPDRIGRPDPMGKLPDRRRVRPYAQVSECPGCGVLGQAYLTAGSSGGRWVSRECLACQTTWLELVDKES